MSVQVATLPEALNFVFNGHRANIRSKMSIAKAIYFKDHELRLLMRPSLEHPKSTTRLVTGRDFEWLKDENFHISDDRTIEGYYKG